MNSLTTQFTDIFDSTFIILLIFMNSAISFANIVIMKNLYNKLIL